MIVIALKIEPGLQQHQEGGFRPPWGVLAFPSGSRVSWVHLYMAPPGLELQCPGAAPIAIGAVKAAHAYTLTNRSHPDTSWAHFLPPDTFGNACALFQ